jgi:hypothetical protein
LNIEYVRGGGDRKDTTPLGLDDLRVIRRFGFYTTLVCGSPIWGKEPDSRPSSLKPEKARIT